MMIKKLFKKYSGFLLVIVLLLTSASCETRVQYNFKVYNFSDKNVVLESSNNHLSMFIPAQSEKTMEFKSEIESFDPSDLIIQNPDSVLLSFEDGKTLTYHSETQIIDSLGKLILVPKRIVNPDTTLFFPIIGISNILVKNEWSKSCNDKKNKVCTYNFEITKAVYNQAK